jgi:parvulin-like peptidyl-prolyl isomerase
MGGGLTNDLNFGSYDGIPINYVPGNYFSQLRSQYSDMYQRFGYGGQMGEMQAWQQSFQETAFRTAALREMARSGYSAPRDEVDKATAALAEFQDNGKFSAAKYNALTKQQQISKWEGVRDDLISRRYSDDLNFPVTAAGEAAFFANMAKNKRSFQTTAFALSAYPAEEAAKFAGENAALFTTLRLSQITVADQKEAESILANVRDGVITFEDAAKNHSIDVYADKGGDRGEPMLHELTGGVPDQENREALARLKKGEFSEVMPVPQGFAFFRCEEDARAASADDGMDKVRSYMISNEKGRVEDYFVDKAQELAAAIKTDGFDAAVLAAGMEQKTLGPISVNYGDSSLLSATLNGSDADYLKNAGADENFWKAAWTTALNTPSEPLVVPGDNIVVLYPTEETQADEAALDNVKSYYTGTFLPNYEYTARTQSVMSSPKFVDKFLEMWLKLIMPAS